MFLAILSNSNIWLLVVNLLGLSIVINGYSYLFYWWLLVAIILMVISGYYINDY